MSQSPSPSSQKKSKKALAKKIQKSPGKKIQKSPGKKIQKSPSQKKPHSLPSPNEIVTDPCEIALTYTP